jgi:hypothetical protein
MSPKDELPLGSGSAAGSVAWSAGTQQHQKRTNRDREEQHPASAPADIPVRRHDVRGGQTGEQTTEYHMRGLEASVTRPETANSRDRAQNHDQKQQARRNPSELVERSRGLQVLNDRAVGENEAADVNSYRNQRGPADERMEAH